MSPSIQTRQNDKRQLDDIFHHKTKDDQQKDKWKFYSIEDEVLGSRQHQIHILMG